MQPIPWLGTATQGNNNPLMFLSQPQAKTSKYKGSQTEGQVEGDLSHPLSKPWPNCLIQSNETPITVNGPKMIALIDSGAQVSSVSSGILQAEGTEGPTL